MIWFLLILLVEIKNFNGSLSAASLGPPPSVRSSHESMHSSSGELEDASPGIPFLLPSGRRQIFCYPTFDSPFKYMMCNEQVRKSFLETFIPGAKVSKSSLDSTYINPIQIERQNINPRFMISVIDSLASSKTILLDGSPVDKNFIKCVKQMKRYSSLIVGSIKPQLRASEMDVVCDVNYIDEKDSSYVAVEIQVITGDYWDQSALYYLAGLYARQLAKGDDFDK